MNEKDLNLDGLTMDNIDFSGVREALKKDKQMEKEYQDKYGDDWWEHYLSDTNPYHNIDLDEKSINEAIHGGYRLCITAHPAVIKRLDDKYWEKMRRLFGRFYKRYVEHEPNNPKVNKALVKDALKSGKWKELPEELQEEYHRLAGD